MSAPDEVFGGVLFAVWVASLVGVVSYLLTYVPSARSHGYRLFSRRRRVAYWRRTAECHGGPMDGERLPVSRATLLGQGNEEWPDVLFNAYDRTYRFGKRGRYVSRDFATVWAGYYALPFLADRYQWTPTGLDEMAVRHLAELERTR